MGKYGPSLIHNKFSKWHWERCGRHAHLTDVDRVWVEMRQGKPLVAIDLKWANNQDNPTSTELCLADWFLEKGIPWYNVYCQEDFKLFRVEEHSTKLEKYFNEYELANWIDKNCKKGDGWR